MFIFEPATIRRSPPPPPDGCNIGSQQMLRLCIWPTFKRSPSTVLYSCLTGLKVKNVHVKPVLEWAD